MKDRSTIVGAFSLCALFAFYHAAQGQFAQPGGLPSPLFREDANTIAQRNSTTAQTRYHYETYTDGSNYSRLATQVASFTGTPAFNFLADAAGSGTQRSIIINAGSSVKFKVEANGSAGFIGVSNTFLWRVDASTGDVMSDTDNAFNIGANASGRPATINAGTLIKAPTATLTTLASDATHTDNTVCVDSSSGVLYKGSGASGICLGTSSARFKEGIAAAVDGLDQVLQLEPKTFRYKPGYGDDGGRDQYGLLAEDVIKVLPKIVGLDQEQKPNSVDMVAMIPILIKAIQEQQVEIDRLKAGR